MEQLNTLVLVACRNASGMADLFIAHLEGSEADYDLGDHYDRAEALAEAAGYERPFVSFDPAEQGSLIAAAEIATQTAYAAQLRAADAIDRRLTEAPDAPRATYAADLSGSGAMNATLTVEVPEDCDEEQVADYALLQATRVDIDWRYDGTDGVHTETVNRVK